jgi:hypothetical protein
MTIEDYYRRDRIKTEKHSHAAQIRMAKCADVRVLMAKSEDLFRRLALAIVVQYDKSPEDGKILLSEQLMEIRNGFENLSNLLDNISIVIGKTK